MQEKITLPPDAYQLLQRRAKEMHSTPDSVAETIIRLQLGSTRYIEQRPTSTGLQAYLRATRVAVRHVAAFLKAGRTAEEIAREDLPHLPVSAIYEAIAYYYDHQEEIEAEIQANSSEAVHKQLHGMLSSEQYARLTGQMA